MSWIAEHVTHDQIAAAVWVAGIVFGGIGVVSGAYARRES